MDIFEDKKEAMFFAIAAMLLVGAISIAFFALNFLGKNLNSALNPSLIKTPEAVKFNLNLMERLRP